MTWQIGCGQITWGRTIPEEQVLAEIAQAGYEGAPANPRGERSPRETVELFARHGLKPAPGYFSADWWDASQRDTILEQADRYAHFAREVGCTELYVAPSGFNYVTRSGKTRRQTAGHVTPADSMTDDEFARFGDTLNEFAARTQRAGVRSCFHNHVGTVVETGEEIDRLLALTDPSVVWMGFDTGHLAWGGVDVVPFCQKYANRIATMHIKDIDGAVRERGAAAGWDYGTFSDNGIFVELGEGMVDLPGVLHLLRQANFDGWLIVETDVTQKPSALESATISRNYLKSQGV